MKKTKLLQLVNTSGNNYNLHTHTEFCDGKSSMEQFADAAHSAGMTLLGFTPHSPLPIASPCNMSWNDADNYTRRIESLRDCYSEKITVLRGMEVDYLNERFGPASDEIANLGLDYTIGSVHFVPNQKNEYIDCDGNVERFAINLKNYFQGDLRYVVEKYFNQILSMIDLGGFDILGHFDKIAGNASSIEEGIEEHGWYQSLIDETIRMVADKSPIVEINTKAYLTRNRFYPNQNLWNKLKTVNLAIVVNSDAHYANLINAGRNEAFDQMS